MNYLTIEVLVEVEGWLPQMWRWVVQFQPVKVFFRKSLNPNTSPQASVVKGAWMVIAHWDTSFLLCVWETEHTLVMDNTLSGQRWLGIHSKLATLRTCRRAGRVLENALYFNQTKPQAQKCQTVFMKKYASAFLVICHWSRKKKAAKRGGGGGGGTRVIVLLRAIGASKMCTFFLFFWNNTERGQN